MRNFWKSRQKDFRVVLIALTGLFFIFTFANFGSTEHEDRMKPLSLLSFGLIMILQIISALLLRKSFKDEKYLKNTLEVYYLLCIRIYIEWADFGDLRLSHN